MVSRSRSSSARRRRRQRSASPSTTQRDKTKKKQESKEQVHGITTSSIPPSSDTRLDVGNGAEEVGGHKGWKIGACVLLAIILLSAVIGGSIASRYLDQYPLQRFLEDSAWSEKIRGTWAQRPELRPGHKLKKEGIRKKHPVVMLPGIVTSKLELWEGKPCAGDSFRQMWWGGASMITHLLLNKECWFEHLRLGDDGLDPPGIRLRAIEDFSGGDFLVADYWVWQPLIESLADVGYDPSSMTLLPYDWRLSFANLEKRDFYLTRLKATIETTFKIHKLKVSVVAHSMGSLLFVYFMQWVTNSVQNGGGGGGKDWVDKHIHSFQNIAGPLLGAPKAVAALMSGEMRDTADLPWVAALMKEAMVGREELRDMFHNIGSMTGLLPKGDRSIWAKFGTPIPSIKQPEEHYYCPGCMLQLGHDAPWQGIYQTLSTLQQLSGANSTVQSEQHVIITGSKKYQQHCSFKNSSADREHDPRCWSDPSVTPLPHAPDMHIYCMYGVGKETEVGYVYMPNPDAEDRETCPWVVNTTHNSVHPRVVNGVLLTDGDGTVPLASLAHICHDWRTPSPGPQGPFPSRLNPGNASVTTRIYRHGERSVLDTRRMGALDILRGGVASGDHVDVMGNHALIRDVLLVVTGHGDKLRHHHHATHFAEHVHRRHQRAGAT